MTEVFIDGTTIHNERDLHRALEAQLDLGEFYGRNVAALRDRLLTDVPRPIHLAWTHADVSRKRLGSELFGRIVDVFEEAAQWDIRLELERRFTYALTRGSPTGEPATHRRWLRFRG